MFIVAYSDSKKFANYTWKRKTARQLSKYSLSYAQLILYHGLSEVACRQLIDLIDIDIPERDMIDVNDL